MKTKYHSMWLDVGKLEWLLLVAFIVLISYWVGGDVESTEQQILKLTLALGIIGLLFEFHFFDWVDERLGFFHGDK